MMRVLMMIMLLLPSLGAAEAYRIGDLVIAQAVALETTPTARTGVGYLVIENTGRTTDQLIDVAGDFPRVMVHETQMTDGVATMTHRDVVEIPAGETVIFAPGGLHIMFMGLAAPFTAGDDIPLRLTFESAGAIDVVLNVQTRATYEMQSGD